jgi:hypothetical protein
MIFNAADTEFGAEVQYHTGHEDLPRFNESVLGQKPHIEDQSRRIFSVDI